MRQPRYIDLEQAREVLAGMGVELTGRQMKRAADLDTHGKRKLPFFVCPIERKLKIEQQTLVNIFLKKQVEAERSCNLN